MAHAERFPWLRRDGAPLAISLVLHVLALLLIAPWLVMRSIPSEQIEVEVMLEQDAPEQLSSQPEKAARLRALVKVERPLAQSVRPQLAQIQPQALQPMQSTVSVVQLPPSQTPDVQEGQGQRGLSAPAPREVAGLSAPNKQALSQSPQPSVAVPAGSGETSLQRGSVEARPVAPLPSLGSTPQPSARAAAAPSQPGEDRQDGPVTLAGPVPQAQAAQPEFRQAARQGGAASLRGGSQAPQDGLARQSGSPDQIALLAASAVPQALPGSSASRGGQPTAELAAPVPRSSGQGRVAATESASPAQAQLARPGTVQGAPSAVRTPAPSGQGSGGTGSGSRTVNPVEQDSGLLTAAAPGTAGPGTAATATGSGASEAGVGRAQQLAGSGSVVREAAAPLMAASGSGATRAEAGSSVGQLSSRAETPAPAQPVREARAAPMQTQQPVGQARVIDERFTAPALKVDSPRSVCELPLLFAGFDRKPIPKGLDTISASEPIKGEIPPRHHPANQSPRYPLWALGQRAEGRALVRAEIRPDGLVGQVWIKQSSGFQALDFAALETVRSWRFYPAQRHGMAVAMWMDVPIEYKVP
jgi:periplasmic protein TonB